MSTTSFTYAKCLKMLTVFCSSNLKITVLNCVLCFSRLMALKRMGIVHNYEVLCACVWTNVTFFCEIGRLPWNWPISMKSVILTLLLSVTKVSIVLSTASSRILLFAKWLVWLSIIKCFTSALTVFNQLFHLVMIGTGCSETSVQVLSTKNCLYVCFLAEQ